MDSHVNFEISTLGEPLITNLALVGLETFMGADVNLESASARVCFVAVGTLIWLFPSVNQLMGL